MGFKEVPGRHEDVKGQKARASHARREVATEDSKRSLRGPSSLGREVTTEGSKRSLGGPSYLGREVTTIDSERTLVGPSYLGSEVIKELIDAVREVEERSKGETRPDRPTLTRFKAATIAAVEQIRAQGDLDRKIAQEVIRAAQKLTYIQDLSKVEKGGPLSYWGTIIGSVVLVIDISVTGGALTLHKIAFEQGTILFAGGVGAATGIKGIGGGLDSRDAYRENEKRQAQLDEVVEAARRIRRANELLRSPLTPPGNLVKICRPQGSPDPFANAECRPQRVDCQAPGAV